MTGLLVTGIACFFIFRLFALHFSDKIQVSVNDGPEKRRGCITDRNGYVLAINVEKPSLFANPEEIENPEEAAKMLSEIPGFSAAFLKDKLGRKKRFVWIRRKMDYETAERIKKIGIPGIYFRDEFQRVYPHGALASNILGFVGMDNDGLEGIEYKYEDILSGAREDVFSAGEAGVIRGGDIALTIDRTVQFTAEKELERGAKNAGAVRGAAVVLEIKTGRVLALARYPRFDPNAYWDYSGDARNNFLVVNSFEPGSTLKVIAMAALLGSHPDALGERFTCNGKIDVADATIKCTGVHGSLDLEGIIKYSCNVGIIQAMKRVSKEELYRTFKLFRFGQPSGLELPGESEGLLRPVSEWSGLSKYSMSIGQEISVTSIQLAAAFGAIANRGVYVEPTIIESIQKDDGTAIRSFYPRTRGRIIKEDVALRLLKMMKSVVEGGTGSRSELVYYQAAGKTGTAQKSMKKGGYSPDKFTTSFIGIAPYSAPEFCILVVLDEPVNITSGGEGAAPVFARIAQRILPYSGVKSSRLYAQDPLRAAPYKRLGTRVVPDFSGLGITESLRVLSLLRHEANISYALMGTGRVHRQSPAPGSPLAGNTKIMLYFNE